MQESLLRSVPGFKPPNSLNAWALDIDKAIRIDSRTSVQVKEVIDWVETDDFWCGNIQSGGKLRKQMNQLLGAIAGEKRRMTKKKPEDRSVGHARAKSLEERGGPIKVSDEAKAKWEANKKARAEAKAKKENS